MVIKSAILCISCACCVAAGNNAYAASDGESLEYAIKAAYLYKFGLYVDWPPTAFAASTSAINLCIAGADPFGMDLDTAIRGQQINGRPIEIHRIKNVGRDSGCHILYLGPGNTQEASQALDAMRGNGVLTVSDMPGVGIINFVIQGDRVRFVIDEEAAAQNGLAISSKLLSLAVNVRPRQTGIRR
ncbi:YfiR family protein [Noviherbaspirillum sp. ST9]|uniref:YfiR family protein n=1 Tax=Noviherbaspirillum sp. ST9 TaxID=3401606 RepID=UPI003B58A73C